jgi:hypothetical protein
MQQIQFVGEDHLDVITSIVANAHHFDAAVAYWSKGSITALDLKRAPAGSTLVCNLFSPNCDPNEVETLFTLKRFNLKRHDGLHAKVYLADDAVCVGSFTAFNTRLRFVKDFPLLQREANLRGPDLDR